ncbi:MAG TPA: SDR family NAD(P)-dependent oxidoreductase, partial [Acetobacteraceae bacterium]|nr:SDR family NAD(P)-dependent oxidoreductase [Acetobacteraceae bacterium]
MAERNGVRDRVVLITGATSGIGLAAATALAGRGARLALVGRDPARTQAAAAQVATAAGGTRPELFLADLGSLAAVRRLAADALERLPRIDVLVNNAGVLFTQRKLNADGFERTWATNHLAPFLLTTLLLDRLRTDAPSRIITTSSVAHQGYQIPFDDLDATARYGAMRRYGETKLANILFTRELARRLAGSGVTANCFHPGLVATNFARNNGGLAALAMTLLKPVARTPQKGAETLVWLADAPEVSAISGGYFVDRKQVQPSAAACDDAAAR